MTKIVTLGTPSQLWWICKAWLSSKVLKFGEESSQLSSGSISMYFTGFSVDDSFSTFPKMDFGGLKEPAFQYVAPAKKLENDEHENHLQDVHL